MRASAWGASASLSLASFVLERHCIVEREPATVGIDSFPGEITRITASEKNGNGCDLLRSADAPERRAHQDAALGCRVGGNRLEDVSHDRTWADCVDTDAVRSGREA